MTEAFELSNLTVEALDEARREMEDPPDTYDGLIRRLARMRWKQSADKETAIRRKQDELREKRRDNLNL